MVASHNPTPTVTMSRTEDLGEGLVILPSLTDSGPAEGVSGHLSSPLGLALDGVVVVEDEACPEGLCLLGSEIFFSIGSASSLPALRNDNGEAVWRLTEKALLHFADSQVRLGPEDVHIRLGRYRGNAGCVSGGTSKAEP